MYSKFLKHYFIKILLLILTFFSFQYFLNWKIASLIIFIIASHEAGHLFALKKIHLDNIGIFFIPFFGGATIPKEGYKTYFDHVLASIMGSLFGALTALIVAFIYKFTNTPIIGASAFLIMAFNAFNLIPLIPLDGGHILKACLFSLPKLPGRLLFIFINSFLMVVAAFKLGFLYASLVFGLGFMQIFAEVFYSIKRDDPSYPRYKIPNTLIFNPLKLSFKQLCSTVILYFGTLTILFFTFALTKQILIKNPFHYLN